MRLTNRSARAALAALALALAGATAAQAADCSLPTPPAPLDLAALPKPKPPGKPDCAEKNRCRPGDVDKYNAAIGVFNTSLFDFNQKQNEQELKVKGYVAALNIYASETDAYLNCEQRRLMAILNSP